MVTSAGVVAAGVDPAAENVTVWVPAEDPAANDAVTPPGRPVAARETCPKKPPEPVTEIAPLALPPGAMVTKRETQ